MMANRVISISRLRLKITQLVYLVKNTTITGNCGEETQRTFNAYD